MGVPNGSCLTGPDHPNFFKNLLSKSILGPPIFSRTQGPIIVGPLQLQNHDYIPVKYVCTITAYKYVSFSFSRILPWEPSVYSKCRMSFYKTTEDYCWVKFKWGWKKFNIGDYQFSTLWQNLWRTTQGDEVSLLEDKCDWWGLWCCVFCTVHGVQNG